MFCVGQTVLYGANGVCTVDEVTKKRIGKSIMEYFVLKPVSTNSSTLFVPTSNQKLLSRIRRVLSKDEAKRILSDLPDRGEWNDNKIERTDRFREIVSDGDSVELIRMIRLLRAHESEQMSKGKRLHILDERFLKEAEKMIGEEFSVVLNVSRDEILTRILQ